MIAARSANENLTPLDVMLAVIRDPQVSLADRVKMALKALPRLHRKPKAGQSGNAIAGSRAATVQSFGTPKDAAGGGTGKDAAATERDPIGGAGKTTANGLNVCGASVSSCVSRFFLKGL